MHQSNLIPGSVLHLFKIALSVSVLDFGFRQVCVYLTGTVHVNEHQCKKI